MNYIIEISLSAVMISFVLFETIKINIFKKDNDALITGLISLLLLGFGILLSIKYSVPLDYGTVEEINRPHAEIMSYFAIANALIGFGFILLSIIKFIIWKIKRACNKN
ncbi:MAG: hypothetical protein PHE33_11535 [Bacteroidales bacterium]|nr:hypothetical protein [Bacteroidales bacterium]